MKGLNLSKFKKMKEDARSATMIHQDGHQLVISKGGLSAIHRKQLENLPIYEAKGGQVQHYDEGSGDVEALDEPENAAVEPQSAQPSLSIEPISGASHKSQPILENTSPYEIEKQANTQEAQAIAKQGKAENQAVQDTSNLIANMPTQNDIVAHNKEASDKLYQAYANKELNPDHYWEDHSKVGAGIGVLLGGLGQVLGADKNGGLEAIKEGINRDIDAQKNSQDQKMNLWKMNREALGSDEAANLATQNQLYTGLKYKIDQAASQAKGPIAIARAKAANAAIDQKIQVNNSLLGLHKGLSNQAGGGSEQEFINNLNTAQRVSPEMAKEAQSKYLPGIGVSTKPLSPAEQGSLMAYKDLDMAIEDARKFAIENPNGAAPGTLNSSLAEQKRSEILRQLQKISGLRPNDHIWKSFEEDVPSLKRGTFFGLAAGADPKLEELQKTVRSKRQNSMVSNGIIPFKKAPDDQQAIAWAQANPNDPNAIKILNLHGIR